MRYTFPTLAESMGVILREFLMRDSHRISRAQLMKKMWMYFESTEEFDEVMKRLIEANMLVQQQIGNVIIYQMPESTILELKLFYAGKLRKREGENINKP